MNPKQLANILVKLIGLDLCLRAVPVLGSIVWLQLQNTVRSSGNFSAVWGSGMTSVSYSIASSAIGPIISVAVGIAVILASRTIVGWLFANEPAES